MMGNPGKRPLNDNEPKPSGIAKCPRRELTGEARKHWRRVMKVLAPLALASDADADAIAAYAVARARWGKAQVEIAKLGEIVVFRGRPLQNPWLAVAASAEQTMLRVAAEIGLTASARTRLFASPIAHPLSLAASRSIADSFFDDEVEDSFFKDESDTSVQ
jgi:P27 family predicted phage terminase small subunit